MTLLSPHLSLPSPPSLTLLQPRRPQCSSADTQTSRPSHRLLCAGFLIPQVFPGLTLSLPARLQKAYTNLPTELAPLQA